MPDHNEALAGDTLYSIQLNHEWRRIVTSALQFYFQHGETGLALDNEDLFSNMIVDLYNAENMGNLVNVQNFNIDLATDKTTTSNAFVAMSGGIVGFTPTKANCEITVSNLDLRHSNVAEVQARIRCNQGTQGQEAIAVMSGSVSKPMSASIKYTAMPVGTPSNIQIEWKVSIGGTATVEADTWINVQIIEYD